jgi:hypothetical protein
MRTNIEDWNQANKQLIQYLSRSGNQAPVIMEPSSVPDPYYGCGSHPDVVEQVWDKLGSVLPRDARCLFCGTPALVHRTQKIVIALALGTQYGLRLPPDCIDEAVNKGAKTYIKWSGNSGDLDTKRDLGPDWVLGSYADEEKRWFKKFFEGLFAP